MRSSSAGAIRISRRTTSASSSHCWARANRRSSATSACLLSGSAVDGAPVGGDRLLELAGLLLVDAREAQQQIDGAARLRRPSRSRSRAASASLAQCAGLGGQPLQVREHVLVVRIDAQRAPVDVERRVLVRQPALLDLGDARQQLDGADRVVAVRRHHLVDRDHAIPLARALVDRLQHGGRQHRLVLARHQRFQRAHRRLVGRIGRQDLRGRPRRRAPRSFRCSRHSSPMR